MREKSDKALRNLKNKITVRVDGILAELWKEWEEKVKNELFQTMRDIVTTQVIT